MSTDEWTYPFPVTDPFQLPAEFSQLRCSEPVRPIRVATGDEVWLVTRYADVRAVLGDRRMSRNIFRPDAAQLVPGVPVRQVSSAIVDPPAHTRWRKLVASAFTPRHVEGMRPQIEKVVNELLDRVELQTPPVDLKQALAYPLSITVLCRLLGIEEQQHRRFAELAETALTINDAGMDKIAAAFVAMQQHSVELIAAKREQPGTDLLSRLIAVHDADEGRLSEDELVATILGLFVGGYESTVNQIVKGLLALLRWPDQLAALRADPSLIGSAVEETLRFAALDSGFGSPRYATADVPVGDVVIPQGATVLVIRQSADRDERQFEDPDRFDVTRGARQHNGFGHGPHHCLGSALARLELEVAIGTVVARFPGLRLAVPPEEIRWDYRLTAAGPESLPVLW